MKLDAFPFAAFGVGSMIYSGLEFAQYFEFDTESHCRDILMAVTPAARMAFTFIQMYFIFLNAKVRTEGVDLAHECHASFASVDDDFHAESGGLFRPDAHGRHEPLRVAQRDYRGDEARDPALPPQRLSP